MKRFLCLIFGVLLLPLLIHAQKFDLDLGVKLGVNFSKLNGDHWDNGYKGNLLGGAFLGVNGGKLGIQLEGLYMQSTYVTGDSFHDLYKDFYNTAADSAKHGSFKVNYLSIPILVNLKLFKATIQLGPQFSSVMSVKDEENLLKDAKAMFKGGWDGVVGLQLNLPFRLNFSARYVMGLSNINKSDNAALKDAWKQRALQVALGYSIL